MARTRLRHVSDSEPGYARQRCGKGFVYLDSQGRRLRDPRVLARIRALAIPPAYTDVWICRSANGHLQASGRDARGRKQYRYHAAWRQARDGTKFARTIEFAEALPALRRRITRDLRERGVARARVLAAVLRLLDRTRIRVGNEEYAKANASYGLSTLRNRHVSVRGDEVLQDARVAAVVRRCRDLPGQHLFQYFDGDRVHRITSGDVNAYLRDVMRGDFSAKDFRTWAASVIVARELHGGGDAVPDLKEAIAVAARTLGNTPAVCQRAYVHPAILEAVGDPPERLRRLLVGTTRPRAGLDRTERAVLRYLRERARSVGKRARDQSFAPPRKSSRADGPSHGRR